MATAPVRRMAPAQAVIRGSAGRTQASALPPPPVRRPAPASTASRKTAQEVGKGAVSTQVRDRDGPYYDSEREVEVMRATFSEEEPAAFVRVAAGMTIKIADYESLRIDCAVTIPCRRDQIEEAYVIASDFVADKIAEEETNWMGSADRTSGKAR